MSNRPLALGAYYPRYDCYLTALITIHGRWDLVTPELGEPMRTPQGPEVGDVLRGVGEPCGCTWEDSKGWVLCPKHQAALCDLYNAAFYDGTLKRINECLCLWDEGQWLACPEHPASCQAVVLWKDETRTEPVQRCGVPIATGETHCSEHIPRCEDCGVADPLDADGRCEGCAHEAVQTRAALSRS